MSRDCHVRRRLTLTTLVMLFVVAGCGTAKQAAIPRPDPAAALLGYWRASDDPAELLYIAHAGGKYLVSIPMAGPVNSPVKLEDAHLVHLDFANGKELSRYVFSLAQGGKELKVAVYFAAPFSGTPDVVVNYRRATGSPLKLADELAHWEANFTIDKNLQTLDDAIDLWRVDHGAQGKGRFPPRSALLPGGTFWRWSHAPHLRNPFTGRPIALAPGAGNFDYRTNAALTSYVLAGHLYGGGDLTYSDSLHT